jgi:transposase
MRKTHEVLRLHFDLKLKQRQIARSANLSQSTVHEYLHRFTAAGLSWPLPEQMSEPELEAALFPTGPAPARAPARDLPDFADIHKELQEHKHVTLQLLWEEYRATHPDGYRYSQFCHRYQQWKYQRDVVMRQEHRPGEKLFVDWAGDKISVHQPDRSGVLQSSLFVAVLGASSYTYAEATEDETMPNWIGAHVRAFEFMGGVAELLIPDNTKTGVSKACRYEPDLNPTYQEMAMHYGLGVLPARRRKPRDKTYVSYCTLSGLCNVESR